MKKSVDRRIVKLAEQLEIAKIDKKIIDRIMEGGEDIRGKTSPEATADWFRGAMIKMDELLDIETRKAVREGCACHRGGIKQRTCTKIAQENESLEERIKAVSNLKYICGSVTLKEDGEIISCPDPDDRYYAYACQKPKSLYRLHIAIAAAVMSNIICKPPSAGNWTAQ